MPDAADQRPDYLTTREVASLLRVRERKIYDMAAAGEIPHRRVTGKLLFPRAAVEAWLAGAREAAGPAREAAKRPQMVVAGSHDPLLDWAIRESGSGLATFFDGSLDGLARMAAGEAAAAGLHVFEPETGGWNLGHAARALAGADVALIAWATRRRGILVAPALAGEIRGVADLAGRRIARRQASAGGGLLLAHLMEKAGLPADAPRWADEVARTETEAAAAVASDAAEAATGLEALARQFGLGFIPLVEERFDLAIERQAFFESGFQRLFGFARGPAFAAKADALGGYDVSACGEVRWNAP